MHHIRLFATMLALLAMGPAAARSQPAEVASLLREVTAAPVARPIAIDVEITCHQSAYKGKPEVVEKQLADLRARLLGGRGPEDPAGVANAEQMLKIVREQFEKGAGSTRRATLFLAPDYSAMVETEPRPGDPQSRTWSVRKGDMYYEWQVRNEIVTILDKAKNGRRDYLEQALDAVGVLGGVPARHIEHSFAEARMVVDEAAARIESGDWCLEVNRPAGAAPEVQSFGYGFKNFHQEEKTSFSGFRMFAGLRMPEYVTVAFSNADYDLTTKYQVLGVREYGRETPLPFVDGVFGYAKVFDHRFEPEVTYLAVDTLSADELVDSWRKDPEALRKHDAEVAASKPKPKPWPSWLN